MTSAARLFSAAYSISSALMRNFDTSDGDVFARGHLVAHEVLKDDSDLGVKIGEVVFAKVDAVEQDLAFGRIVEAGNELDDGSLSLAVFADQRDALAGTESEVEVAEDAPLRAGIVEGDVAKFEAAHDGLGSGKSVHLRFDARLHFKEGQQVGEEQGLVGNAGCGGEGLLNIRHGLHDGGGDQGKIADAIGALDGAPDAVAVGAVVTKLADDGEHAHPRRGDAG